jgi:hypothetical protein
MHVTICSLFGGGGDIIIYRVRPFGESEEDDCSLRWRLCRRSASENGSRRENFAQSFLLLWQLRAFL